MKEIPSHISILFIGTLLLSLILMAITIYKSFSNAKQYLRIFIIASVCWILVQSALSIQGFYYINPNKFPPNFPILVLPVLLCILLLFLTAKGKVFIDGLDMAAVTMVHIIRIPVELILYALFVFKAVPDIMTFAGRNFDIFIGISAPIVIWIGYRIQNYRRGLLIAWNIIGLLLLANVVTHAILSAPFFFQQLAFEQPNIAVLYFPYSLLPAYIVPLVLFCHLVSLRQLIYVRGS